MTWTIIVRLEWAEPRLGYRWSHRTWQHFVNEEAAKAYIASHPRKEILLAVPLHNVEATLTLLNK